MASNTTEVKHECNICFHTLKTASSLSSHKKYVHGEKKFKCEHCNKKYTNQDKLGLKDIPTQITPIRSTTLSSENNC